MEGCKQDMPPAGGYAPITYKRIPLNQGLSGRIKLAILCCITTYGWYRSSEARREINNEKIEMRCSRQGFRPMLEAEFDRMILKQLKRNRDAEERIMKDVEGWEVGKYKGSPVFLTVGPDEYFQPCVDEYYAHAPRSAKLEAADVDLYR